MVHIHLQLAYCEILPIERTQSNLTADSCLELSSNLADIVIVDGVSKCRVRNRPHLDFTSHLYLVGVCFNDRFHGLRIPRIHYHLRNIAELLRYFVVRFELVRILYGLELGDGVSSPNHENVTMSRAWEGMTVKITLEARRICGTTVRPYRSSTDELCVTNFSKRETFSAPIIPRSDASLNVSST